MIIQQDKISHFVVSFLLILSLTLIFNTFIAVSLTILIGLLKEIYDKYFGTGFSIGDLIANGLGIITALLIFIKL